MDVMSGTTRQAVQGRTLRLGLRAAGGVLLAATGAIHLDLYLTGYRSVPTIGWLFLLQVIAAFGLALAQRPLTAEAFDRWRAYVLERDAPLSRRERTVVASHAIVPHEAVHARGR